MLSEPPKVIIGKPQKEPKTVEVQKGDYKGLYEKCWDLEDYRIYSPGERLVSDFIGAAKPYKTQTVIDWGCGSGRAGYKLYKDHGLNVTLVDFAANCLDENVRKEAEDNENLRFVQLDLTKDIDPEKLEHTSQYGFCTDVLEHIPEEDVDAVLENILSHSKHVFFQISCIEDHFGAHDAIRGDKDREHLHVCVHNYQWWLRKFVDYGVTIHRSADLKRSCLFYVSAYTGEWFDTVRGYVNVPAETVIENIRHSATLDVPQIRPMETQDLEIMLLAGGPSLSEFEEEIIQNRKDGMKLVTVNGAYNWAMDRGLKPSLQFLIDSRGFNKRFAEQNELTEETKFCISSAADPEVFELLPHDRTWIFHTSLSDEIEPVMKECYGEEYKDYFPVPGGCTVTLRAIVALRMLGFYKIHVYGFDSCIMDDKHHAYDQPENEEDAEKAVTITVAPGSKWEKKFLAAPWMLFQAIDFKRMASRILPDVLLDVKGDGMIAYMIQTAAEMNRAVDLEIDAVEHLEDSEKPPPRAYVRREAS